MSYSKANARVLYTCHGCSVIAVRMSFDMTCAESNVSLMSQSHSLSVQHT